MKIYLSEKDMKFKKEIQEMLENLKYYDPNFNGVEYNISISEFGFTNIDGIDEINGSIVLNSIRRITTKDDYIIIDEDEE